MIKHIVMWNVSASSAEERLLNIELVREAFEGLRGNIPGMLRLEIGVDTSRAPYACDVVLYSEFESREALAAYAEHPDHAAVRTRLEGVRTVRHQVDYEVAAER